MKVITKILFILVLFVFSSCDFKKKSESKELDLSLEYWKQIKDETNLWDLRIFIERYPKSCKLDSAINLFLTIENDYLENGEMPPPPPWHCGRNCRQVLVNQKDEILFNGIKTSLDSLFNYAYGFISDTSYYETYPEFKEFKDDDGDTRMITKAKFEVVFIKDSVINLQKVIIEIRKAYDELKNNLSLKWYNKELEKLSIDRKAIIDSCFERRIILTDITDFPHRWRNKHFKTSKNKSSTLETNSPNKK